MKHTITIKPNRNHLRKMIGALVIINDVRLTTMGTVYQKMIAESKICTTNEVEWSVIINSFKTEGRLLVPKGGVIASAIVIPDADEIPKSYAGLKTGPRVAL